MKKTLKCKSCKEPHTPFSSLDNWCKKIDCQTKKALFLLEKKKVQDQKVSEVKFKEMEIRVKAPARKKDLQKDINKLARLIDSKFNYKCIDCGKEYGKQTDAAHLHNSQGNENIRFNLHNLHSAKSDCNQFSSEHKVGYRKGIEKRYGAEYLNYIDNEIPLKFKYIGLLENEVKEKLSIVRKLIRTFDTFKLIDGIQARNMFNTIIGIYKEYPIENSSHEEDSELDKSF